MTRFALPTALICLAIAAPAFAAPHADPPRQRLRALGITVGHYPTGPWNAITDVAGVKVGHATIAHGDAHTGVTAIVPRDDVWHQKCFAGGFVLNGNGELTATNWVAEAGWLETPILWTDTLSVGRVDDAMVSWMKRQYPRMGRGEDVVLPMVGECDDEFLNDQRARFVSEKDVFSALDGAASGPVAEGAVGAGTGMVSYRFKGGIGTASRVLPASEGAYTVGVIVNCNMGARRDLRVDGVPVGEAIQDLLPTRKPSEGSIMICVATNAPLLPHQLQRLARRAAVGLARTGTTVHHGSGDFVMAFSTAAKLPGDPEPVTMSLEMVHNTHLDGLFEATIEATEEAILNALCMATTTVGFQGHTAYALPLDRLQSIMRAHGRGGSQPIPRGGASNGPGRPRSTPTRP